MKLFRRAPQSRFPADMVTWLETFGRYKLDPMSSRTGGDVQTRLPLLYEDAKTDQDGFLADLGAFITHDQGGFVTLGAAGLAWELFGEDVLRIPAALPLIDAGIAVKTARDLPGLAFTSYEQERIRKLRGRG